MARRKHLHAVVADEVLVACRRKCCLCYYLLDNPAPRKGQIAHLNKKRSDNRLENLVWLCFDHHDEFDSTTRQSKGVTIGEVRTYRDRLIAELAAAFGHPARQAGDTVGEAPHQPERRHPWRHPWRFPLWLTADQPELFAYSAPSADGICAIERIDLPDGRIVFAYIQVPGNPGNSVTNCTEYLCSQLCERFDLPLARIVWLENYEYFDRDDWRQVQFEIAADGALRNPEWTPMNAEMWAKLRLSPKKRLTSTSWGALRSKIRKHFPWPPCETVLGLGAE